MKTCDEHYIRGIRQEEKSEVCFPQFILNSVTIFTIQKEICKLTFNFLHFEILCTEWVRQNDPNLFIIRILPWASVDLNVESFWQKSPCFLAPNLEKKQVWNQWRFFQILKNDHVILGSLNQFGFNRFSRLLVHVYSTFVW